MNKSWSCSFPTCLSVLSPCPERTSVPQLPCQTSPMATLCKAPQARSACKPTPLPWCGPAMPAAALPPGPRSTRCRCGYQTLVRRAPGLVNNMAWSVSRSFSSSSTRRRSFSSKSFLLPHRFLVPPGISFPLPSLCNTSSVNYQSMHLYFEALGQNW